jgi:hypothetical protein
MRGERIDAGLLYGTRVQSKSTEQTIGVVANNLKEVNQRILDAWSNPDETTMEDYDVDYALATSIVVDLVKSFSAARARSLRNQQIEISEAESDAGLTTWNISILGVRQGFAMFEPGADKVLSYWPDPLFRFEDDKESELTKIDIPAENDINDPSAIKKIHRLAMERLLRRAKEDAEAPVGNRSLEQVLEAAEAKKRQLYNSAK